MFLALSGERISESPAGSGKTPLTSERIFRWGVSEIASEATDGWKEAKTAVPEGRIPRGAGVGATAGAAAADIFAGEKVFTR